MPQPPVNPRLTVAGEALVDLVPGDGPGRYEARPGGSPFNVAVGLARLGQQVTLMARLADNAFGRLLRARAKAEGIDLGHAPTAAEPTTLAVVSLDGEARATYDFYAEGTADWQWSAEEIGKIPDDTAVLHLGSIASWTPPGDERIHEAAARLHDGNRALVSYDPNVRPALLGRPADARLKIERSVTAAHLVKASREDAEWLYPSPQEAARRWLTLGALLVVITDGPDGAYLYGPGHDEPRHRPGRRVRVADTVGAGDAFTAGLLAGLTRRGLHTPEALRATPPGALAAAADEAVLISALTCQRPGADPPRMTQADFSSWPGTTFLG
jgi:fructokinase